VASGIRKARDLDLLDAVDAFSRESFSGHAWRVVREGRDPVSGSPSNSRWCNGSFDVLYTSLDRNGAMAEIHSFLSAQPVFPSRMTWKCHQLAVQLDKTLRLADLPTLQRLGVETSRFRERHYERCQDIADAAYFLGFDGLIAPNARWACLNLMLFTQRIAPEAITLIDGQSRDVDWTVWRKSIRPQA
jgi:hypothetical protein